MPADSPAATASPGPLRSMTGFGRGRSDLGAVQAEVELRSVNGKGLNMKVRVPPERLELEARLESRVRRVIERGTLQGQLRVQLSGTPAPALDMDALRFHLREWRKAERELKLDSGPVQLAQLLALPGSFATAKESAALTRKVEKASLAAMDAALQALDQARLHEGARLARELMRLCRKLRSHLGRAARRAPTAVRAAQKRLRERVAVLLSGHGAGAPIDLARELAVLADRADVQEEIARLEIHLDRVEQGMIQGGAVGRELEFILQECHREITTLGNKSSDPALSKEVVAMKLLAGQMKEQLANVE